MGSKTILDWELGIIHIHISKQQRREHTKSERKLAGAWKLKWSRSEAKKVKHLAKQHRLDEITGGHVNGN